MFDDVYLGNLTSHLDKKCILSFHIWMKSLTTFRQNRRGEIQNGHFVVPLGVEWPHISMAWSRVTRLPNQNMWNHGGAIWCISSMLNVPRVTSDMHAITSHTEPLDWARLVVTSGRSVVCCYRAVAHISYQTRSSWRQGPWPVLPCALTARRAGTP